MRHLALAAALLLCAAPVTAQDVDPERPGLLERGAELMLQGLLEQLGPAIGSLESAMMVMGRVVEELGGYEAPEILPNGDIIIRRRPGEEGPPLPPTDPSLETPQEGGEVEL